MKNVLAEHGITAVLDGEESAGTLGYMGPAADARLLVPTIHLEQARELVEGIQAELRRGGGPAWFCGPCQEEVAGTFDYCWSCQRLRADVEDPSVDLPPVSDEQFEPEQEADAPIKFDSSNPYSSSQNSYQVGVQAFSEDEAVQVDRAFRASVVGLCFLPCLMTIYSIMLLVTVPTAEAWPDHSSRRYYQAWMINVLAVLLWGSMYLLLG